MNKLHLLRHEDKSHEIWIKSMRESRKYKVQEPTKVNITDVTKTVAMKDRG